MLGISSDHTEAATITPAAKPKNARCISLGMSFLNRNTVAEPSTVARKVNRVPMRASATGDITAFLLVCKTHCNYFHYIIKYLH